MHHALAPSIVEALLGLKLGDAGSQAGNRVSLEGVTFGSAAAGVLDVGVARLEAASLRLVSGAYTLEIGSLALHGIVAQVGIGDGSPRLRSLQVAGAELSGARVHGPLAPPAPAASVAAPSGGWSLGPLATADGTVRAEIVDAQLVFDADVTVPIRQGTIDFKDTKVEHVGPDSRMGVSRLGVYVDAPNGRSYLYQFSSAPVAGVEYEKRGAMLGPWVTHRGSLRLQEFAESLLRQGPAAPGAGFTEQSRLLFERTAVSGDLRLGDGKFSVAGVQAELVERASGRNALRLHSEAVGRGLTIELPLLSLRQALCELGALQAACDELTGALTVRLSVEGNQLRFAFDVAGMKASGLRVRPAPTT